MKSAEFHGVQPISLCSYFLRSVFDVVNHERFVVPDVKFAVINHRMCPMLGLFQTEF